MRNKRLLRTLSAFCLTMVVRKSLDLPTNFSIVNSASEAVPNRLSVVIRMINDSEKIKEVYNALLKLGLKSKNFFGSICF